MAPLSFHPASRYSLVDLSALFTTAYSDYVAPVQIDADGLATMASTYDIDLDASRVGVMDDRPVALALLAARGWRGWIGGMGVVPEYRGLGAGMAVMRAAIESARASGLRTIDLEVLTGNLPALRIYEALGFRRRRVLDIWLRESDATFPMPPQRSPQPLETDACLSSFDELHAVASPWQRDLPTLQRLAPSLQALGIEEDGQIAAYVLYRLYGARINIVDAAAAAGRRAQAVESVLRTLIRDRSGSVLRFVNLPQDDPAAEAMHRVGAEIEMQQHEMTLEL
jgi:ribosomal protein S18 acetylase RimI-like enzyme